MTLTVGYKCSKLLFKFCVNLILKIFDNYNYNVGRIGQVHAKNPANYTDN